MSTERTHTANTDERSALVRLKSAAKQLLDRMSGTYTARNGRQMGIEADDGEKCWIVHSDDIEDLRAALSEAGSE